MSEEDRNPESNRPSDGKPSPRVPVPSRGMFSWIIIFGLALMLVIMLTSQNRGNEISIDEFWLRVENGDVAKIVVRDTRIEGQFDSAQTGPNGAEASDRFICNYPNVAADFSRFQEKLDRVDAKRKVKVKHLPSTNGLMSLIMMVLPFAIVMALGYFLIFRQLRQSAGGAGILGNFGRSRHRMTTKEHTHITFDDVAGIQEAKDEVFEIVEFLRNPKRFQRLGGRIPRGVLLVGEPGCGKTLLAKAIAGEAEVPFFSISGSDFVEMFVGVGASRVRDLFRQAKENSPCIIFLDEIDAVGRRRGVGYSGGGHDEREQTLNAILVEMDGFDSNDQVIVIAATNRADVLDPALVRPGRFDRQVFVPLPDVRGRYEILKVHAKKVKIQPPLEPKLQRLAKATPMFSGADLAALINESALLATLAGKDAVDLEDLEESRDKVRWGRAKRSRVVEERDRVLTAYHEAGHALVQSLLPEADPVHKVSIIPRGPYGGATFSLPEKERMAYSRNYAHATLRVLCAGRIAEDLCGSDMNSGAAGDIKQGTSLIRTMVTQWGMSDRLGFVFYGDEQSEFGLPSKEFSEKTSEQIDEEVRRIMSEAYADAKRMIEAHRPQLESIAQALLKYETIDGEEVRKLLRGETIDRPTVADIIKAEQTRRSDTTPVARPIVSPPDSPSGPLPSPA
ncbi:MAG: ATP-dependent zinc metalloprotease FtsH [Phycisphaerae bacterium]|nr:ATP-dependent zinc metalloprotease FtsH [Phycisphaerae bacterium]